MKQQNPNGLSRRNFLKVAGLTGVSMGLAACAIDPNEEVAQASLAQATAVPTGEPEDMATAAPTTAADAAADMDTMHEAGVKTFVDRIGQDPAFWGTPLEYTMDGDVKVFELTCAETPWEVQPENVIKALTYNGILPGPEIRVTQGDKVRVIVHNEMSQSTGTV